MRCCSFLLGYYIPPYERCDWISILHNEGFARPARPFWSVNLSSKAFRNLAQSCPLHWQLRALLAVRGANPEHSKAPLQAILIAPLGMVCSCTFMYPLTECHHDRNLDASDPVLTSGSFILGGRLEVSFLGAKPVRIFSRVVA